MQYLRWKKSQLVDKADRPRLDSNNLDRGGFSTDLYLKYQRFRDKSDVFLHVPRTLDESYYTRIECARDRDFDQVIYRYVQKREDEDRKLQEGGEQLTPGGLAGNSKDPARFHPRILMINQLWLWKIGGRRAYPNTI